jgi:diguanylate cyclase (GGDEF)-like protein/PAS domain S-box-containing protein
MSDAIRILHLEDSLVDAKLIERLLSTEEPDCVIQQVMTRDQFINGLNTFKPDIILADYTLPDFDGMQALAICQADFPEIPFIFVTGTLGEDIAVESLQNGASDYIIKDRMTRLPTSIHNALEKQKLHVQRLISEKKLAEAQALMATVLENVGAYVYLKDTTGHYTFINPRCLVLWDLPIEKIIGATDDDLFDKNSAAIMREHDRLVILDGKTVECEENATAVNSSKTATYWAVKIPLRQPDGTITGLCGISTDITERKLIEIKLQHTASALASLTAVNRSLVHANSEQELFRTICSGIVESSGYQMAWIGSAQDEDSSIIVLASSGDEDDYLTATLLSRWDEHLDGSLTIETIRTATTQVCQDIATEAIYAPWHDDALKCDYASAVSLPLKDVTTGQVFGICNVYADSVNAFQEKEIELLKEMACDIAFGVNTLRTRDKHNKAIKELLFQNEEKEKRAAELAIADKELLFQNDEKEKRAAELVIANQELSIAAIAFESQAGIMVTDANNIILRVNAAFTVVTGYEAEEVVGQTPALLSSGRQDRVFYEAMWQSLNQTGLWEGEIWNRRKNGETYLEYLTIKAVKDASGVTTNFVATLLDITLRKAAEEEIKNLAFYDPLTQLPNRRLLTDRLKQALINSTRRRLRGAILLLDLDYFKTLNDTLGHDVGDLLLQQVAQRLTLCIREGDTASRIGGDEFVMLLEDLSEQAFEAATQTEVIAQKILNSLNQPYQLGDVVYHSSPSIGATLFYNHDAGLDAILKQADIAMYQAKNDGRNAIRFYDPKMQEAITVRVAMEKDLRNAIENNAFQLHYQIQVNSAGQALGAEVLIRWIHPERGIISPLNFIPLAEETALILPIGQWVLDTACARLKIWEQNPLMRDLVLAVNVSAIQFHQDNFVEQVLATIARHDINPTRLKLELTESMLVENINGIISIMEALSKIGISFSLDDFGTGYSSLQYLKKLPLNQLKIDQSFVRDLVTDASDWAIVRTIITMADGLDIDVIAEGVETQEQRQYLLDSGCTNYQGYLFSKPVPVDEFEALLKKS